MILKTRTAAICIAVMMFMAAGTLPGQSSAKLVELAKAQQDYVVQLRHEFHQHPEVRWTEDWTIGRIRQEVAKILGLPSTPPVDFGWETKNPAHKTTVKGHMYERKGGLIVDLVFDPSFKRNLFRADIDALPIQEATGPGFTSLNLGVMHGCGHDTHVAMKLGALKVLLSGDVNPGYNLRIVFERSEENPFDGRSGALTLVGEGVLDGVDEVYGLHIWVGDEGRNGSLMSRPGPILANNDQFFIRIHTTGGHVAFPQGGSNAIEVGAAIMSALEGFDRRTPLLGPMAPSSIVPAAFLAGNETQANVRPAEAKLTYSCRTFLNQEDRKKLAAAIEQKVRDTVKQFPDAKVDFEFTYGYPATINDVSAVARVSALVKAAGLKYEETGATLGGESFSYYLQQRPGADFYLSAWQKGTGGHHSPTFNPDESVLWQGVAYWLLLATK